MVVTASRTRAPRSVVALRAIGWTLVVAGLVVVLYLVYSLLFTSRETDAAQSAFADEWASTVSGVPADAPLDDAPSEPEPGVEPVQPAPPGPEEAEDGEDATGSDADAGGSPSTDDPTVGGSGDGARGNPDEAVAILEFSRPDTGERPVASDPLYVVGDVTIDALKSGPGHYPRSADPGEDGNFAVAGHRTTYGAPFFRLDELRPGDVVRVTDRDGRRHTYRVREQRIVSPGDAWVVDPEPLDSDGPMLTLTTCHPRFSARQRLVVWAELV